jgi:hypothetical protein
MTNISEKKQLMSLLVEDETTLVNLRCFPGDASSVTNEEICAQIRSAIMQKKSGAATVSKRFNDVVPKVDVRAWLTGLQR